VFAVFNLESEDAMMGLDEEERRMIDIKLIFAQGA
jgi:hypothetical protein